MQRGGRLPNTLRTLVLNADYAPLSACHPVRGAMLVSSNRAHALEGTDIIVRAEKLSFSIPAVIVLASYQTIVPYKDRRTSPPGRWRILERDNHTCQYCGDDAETVDHVVPRSKGGDSGWTNMVAACRPCNERKSFKSVKQAGMKLRSVPKQPVDSTGVATLALVHKPPKSGSKGPRVGLPHKSVFEAWAKYLPL